MDDQQGVVVQIIRDLAANEARWYAEAEVHPDLRPIYAFLETRFPKLDEALIAAVARGNPDSGSLHQWGGGFVRLPPCQTGAWTVPVMTAEYRTHPRKMGLRVGLFVSDLESGSVKSVGYRFESPDLDGEHPYFHMQHILELGHGSGELPTPNWIPQLKPALPLEVRSDVGLLLCLLASLYGWASDLVQQVMNAQYRAMLSTHVQDLAWAPNAAVATD